VAIARVQSSAAAATTTGTGTVTPTLPSAVTAGNHVVIFAAQKTAAGGATINTPAGWTQADQSPSQISGVACAVFYKENASAGLTLPAITPSAGTSDMWVYAVEYSGIATASSLDVHTTGGSLTSASTLTTGTTGTDAQASELLVGVTANPNVQTLTSDAMGGTATGGTIAKLGEATSGNATAASKVTARAYEYIATGTGTAEFHGSVSPARGWAGVVATFKEAVAAQIPAPRTVVRSQAVNRSAVY
jgi:hypothetical protein